MPGFLADVLTWPLNYYNAAAVETAVNMGIPPTSLLTEEQPSKLWSREDKKLAIAFTIMQKETCSRCGQPLWICRSSNSNLTFSVRKNTCYVSAALEKYADSKLGKNLKKGEYTYSVPVMLGENQTLPSRAEYLESLNDD